MEQLSSYKEKLLVVKDKITGFRGTVVGHADYITGCDQYLVQPDSYGEWKEGRWFDHARLEVVEVKAAALIESHDNGADQEAPKK